MTRLLGLTCLGIVCGTSVAADSQVAARSAVPATVEVETSSTGSGVETRTRVEVFGADRRSNQGDLVRPRDVKKSLVLAGSPTATLVSGTIVSADGLIATHGLGSQAADAKLTVRLGDGRSLSGELVVNDKRTGLQLLRVDATNLPAIAMAANEVVVGQNVAGVVTVAGYRNTLVEGIVSALNRAIAGRSPLAPMIQTDLQAGPGSSGSPVVNKDGEVVGIVAAVAAGRQGGRSASGVTFAVPARAVREMMDAIKDGEAVTIRRGFLGVELQEDSRQVTVGGVRDGSPAEAAGIVEGDHLIAVDGNRIESVVELMSQIAGHAAGSEVALEVQRGDDRIKLGVTLGDSPEQAEQSPNSNIRIYGVKPSEFKLELHAPHAPQLSQVIERLKKIQGLNPVVAPPAPPTIRVERSNVEDKLDKLSKSLRKLEKQIARLANNFDVQVDSEDSE